MKKYFLITTVLFTVSFAGLSQSASGNEPDRLRIDSLRKVLPLLKDTAKVDCLNQLAILYNYSNAYTDESKMDSIYYYATEANKEATKIGYKKGIAFSLVNLSRTQLFASKNVPAAEKLLKEAISIGESINNPDVLGWAYYVSGDDKKAIGFFQIAGDEDGEAEASNWLCVDLLSAGKYEEGFSYCEKCEVLSKKTRNYNIQFGYFLREFALYNMGELYKAAGDYETAMNYYQQARKQALLYDIKWGMEIEIGELFCYMGQYDSAFSYLKKYTDVDPNNPWAAAVLGETHLMKKQYDTALKIFMQCIYGEQYRKYNSGNKGALMRAFLFAGKAYAEKKNYLTALKYENDGLRLAQKDNSRPLLIYCYESLSDIYHHLGKNDSAYHYLLKYTTLKDSVLNKQFLFRLNNYKQVAEHEKKQAQLLLLNKDNQLKTQQLKQEALIRNGLIAGFFGFILIALFILRSLLLKRKNEKLKRDQLENEMKLQQLENEKKQAAFQQQAVELEMQALRAQMNPHFIFNCLSSINRIILKNESKTASDYLTRFSRLIRLVLINSQKAMIPLEDELQMLRLYLDMERLRFKNSFDYVISFTNEIDAGGILVPPLLLQPFCENAVWHGLMQKEGQGHLTIDLSMQDNILQCIIADDGIGRDKAADLKSKSAEKEKSMGLKITTQRLALLNRDKQVQTFFTIEDIVDENKNVAGTKVILKICYKELAEEFV